MPLTIAQKKVILAAFLGWMLEGGQSMTADLSYAPLPASVVDATSKRYLEAYRRVTGSELKV